MEDINKFMSEFVGEIMQQMLDKEFDEHMKYKKGKRSENTNSRNGKSSSKNVKTNYGEVSIDMPRDREGSFNPVVVPKRKRILLETADTIIMMYAKGNSISDIKKLIKQIYNVDISEEFICETTKMVSEEIIAWENRKLKEIYKAPTLESAEDASRQVLEKYKTNKILIKKLKSDIPHMLQLFEYTENIRKLVYTTNPIESLNSTLRKVTNGKGCFINEEALNKVLYLRIKELKEKCGKNKTKNWQTILNELIMIHGERVEKYIKI